MVAACIEAFSPSRSSCAELLSDEARTLLLPKQGSAQLRPGAVLANFVPTLAAKLHALNLEAAGPARALAPDSLPVRAALSLPNQINIVLN